MSDNSTALVTGASGGLGAEIARVLAQEGFDLMLVARNEQKLQALARGLEADYGIEAQTFPCDLAREDAGENVPKIVLNMTVQAAKSDGGSVALRGRFRHPEAS